MVRTACTCDRGTQLCNEAVQLWDTATRIYLTDGYTPQYEEALDTYNDHFADTEE